MGNSRLGRFHKGLGVAIGIHMLLNIGLLGCRGELTVLDFLMGLAGGHFFKLNPRLRKLNICLSNLRFLTGTSLGVFSLQLLQKTKKTYVKQHCLKDSRQPKHASAAKAPK